MPRNVMAYWMVLVISPVALLLVSCGGTPAALPGTPAPTVTKLLDVTAEPPKQYKVGDVAQFADHTIAVNKANVADGILTVNITIANTGSSEIIVSSPTQFVARDGEDNRGKLLSDEEGSRGYWKLKGGEKAQDDLKFKFSAAAKGFKLYYTRTTLITTGRGEQPIIFILD